MNKLAINERLKLLANFANTVAAAFLSAGVIGPGLAFFYGLAPNGPPATSIVGVSLICVVASATIHLGGRAVLGRIQE
ncbi:hypothetical protein [Tardiphaga sp.]|uniref:hypothetical protein n=1 Tax=Tardiphaga sp. TaxID=1926292 RepID=UPI0026195267|nr:hypothetical protein [Tardiphaga sp.]